MVGATLIDTTRAHKEDGALFPPSVAVLIPAWEPPDALVGLVQQLLEKRCSAIIVVDDGSSTERQKIFGQLSALRRVTLLRHAKNAGKGAALKTGFRYLLARQRDYVGVVTADADGQHTPGDIGRVACALVDSNRLVLGARGLQKNVPFRSKLGNLLTRWAFCLLTRSCLSDTQTGLRGLPMTMLPELVDLQGDRYEYEMTVLVHLCESMRAPLEIPISTIYLDGNRSSHFDAVRDSIRIYSVLLRLILRKISFVPAAHEDAAY